MFAVSIIFWGVVFMIIYAVRPASAIHLTTQSDQKTISSLFTSATVFLITMLLILPMSMSPFWNGEFPEHRNQYEILAESILKGHLYLDYDDVDPRLEEMENPYDFEARMEEGVNYHFDTAYYKGHYYMYFGVVPVFLLFLPFRFLTGTALTTYHATQIFTVFSVIGFFALFGQLSRRFFPKLPLSVYCFLSGAMSVMSIWYCVGTPALYTTAIVSGICMELWSLFFFTRAVYISTDEKKSLHLAFWGALFGALAFGCRPPVALGNLLVIPMLIDFLKKRKITVPLLIRLFAAALPYVVIGMLLALYNDIRFENPFEFGQAYQLTVTDQHLYGSFRERFNFSRELGAIFSNFAGAAPTTDEFPYISFSGTFVNFPILLLVIGFLFEPVSQKLKASGLRLFVLFLTAAPVIITLADAYWAPSLAEKYRMDIYYLMALSCFLVSGFWFQTLSDEGKRKFSSFLCIMSCITVFTCFLFFLIPNDVNPAAYYPEIPLFFKRLIMFGRV